MKTTFTTTIIQAEGKNATGIRVPTEAIAALGTTKRPKVTVSLNGYTYRSTVAAYGDLFMLPVSAEHREAVGRQGRVIRLRSRSSLIRSRARLPFQTI